MKGYEGSDTPDLIVGDYSAWQNYAVFETTQRGRMNVLNMMLFLIGHTAVCPKQFLLFVTRIFLRQCRSLCRSKCLAAELTS